MARDLKTDMETLRTVLAYAEKRDFERAAALAEQTLADGFEHPLLLNVVATQREREGKFEESLALLRRAVAMAPKDVGARNALALCLQQLDRPGEALTHVDELLKQQPNLAFAHANKGNALIALGSLGRAKASHLRALELMPGHLVSTAALASIASHRGEHAEARQWAEKALAISPGFPDAVMALAAAELAGGAASRAETLLHQMLLDSRVSAIDKARASGLLGDVLDALGRPAEAFDAYSTCNEALRQLYRRFGDGTTLHRYARALGAALRGLGPEVWKPPSRSAAPAAGALEHVFLIGFPRSGTTLLEVILDGHPQIASLEEHELLEEGVRKYMGEPLELEALAKADEAQLRTLRAAYWARVQSAGVDVQGRVFVDKLPLNTLKLPLIARLFPRAKILFAVRDPRDVVLACFRRRFTMNASMYELLTLPGAANFYAGVMDFAAQMRPCLGLEWRVVRYEDLVTDVAVEVAAICGFLGLMATPAMIDFSVRARSREHATPSTAQLARGLERTGIGQWRRYSAALEPVLPILERFVLRYGYPAHAIAGDAPDSRGEMRSAEKNRAPRV
jgi:tetratricopeptide (TPR) repeat protein